MNSIVCRFRNPVFFRMPFMNTGKSFFREQTEQGALRMKSDKLEFAICMGFCALLVIAGIAAYFLIYRAS